LIVLELLEKGELQKLEKRWWIDKGECVVEDTKVLRFSVRFAASVPMRTFIRHK